MADSTLLSTLLRLRKLIQINQEKDLDVGFTLDVYFLQIFSIIGMRSPVHVGINSVVVPEDCILGS